MDSLPPNKRQPPSATLGIHCHDISRGFPEQYSNYLRNCQLQFMREGDEPDEAGMKARMKANYRAKLADAGEDPWQPLIFTWFTDFTGRPAMNAERP